MHLQAPIYQFIKSGTKRIELRLLDKKRKTIKLGDEIIFISRGNGEKMRAKVVGLLYYQTFPELVADYSIEILTDKSATKEELLKELNKFYPKDERENLGVVGIRFELV